MSQFTCFDAFYVGASSATAQAGLPYLTAVPVTSARRVVPGRDAFLVLGSDGVWELLFNEEAAAAAVDAALGPASPAERVMQAVLSKVRALKDSRLRWWFIRPPAAAPTCPYICCVSVPIPCRCVIC